MVWLMVRPLTNAPVVDSWVYAAAARHFEHTGVLRFAGFMDAMPVAQIVLGAWWMRIFGSGYASLDLMLAAVGAAGALMFFMLALRCGAGRGEAALATALIVCNPYYLFLSFSFMTDVAFIAMMVAALLAFSRFDGSESTRWLWIAAALTVGAFLVRPFAGAIAAGCAGALIVFDFNPARTTRADWPRLVRELAPFVAAVALCAAVWCWLTILRPPPWDLLNRSRRLKEVFAVAPGIYILGGVLGPALDLGILLSPLAILQWRRERMREGAVIAAAIFLVTWILVREHLFSLQPQLSCFGGWRNALVLRGMPSRYHWTDWKRLGEVAWGSVGATGIFFAARDAAARFGRSATAVALTAFVYWLAMLPLWLFANRYYLVLLPAGALTLAMVPMPRGRVARLAGVAMALAIGWVAIAGVYDCQRGMGAVMDARDWLLDRGVPRQEIDAGYPLDGQDLYRYPRAGIDTQKMEMGIPMLTSARLASYTIAVKPLAGTEIIRRYRWQGLFGFGTREIYVLRRIRTPPPPHAPLEPPRARTAVYPGVPLGGGPGRI